MKMFRCYWRKIIEWKAFELVNCIFYEIGNRDIDDSDGGTSFVADNCYEYWQTILQECNDKEKEICSMVSRSSGKLCN